MKQQNDEQRGPRISASVLAADFLRLEEDLRAMEAHCDAFHLDVMDGHYVPNISFGPDICAQIRRGTEHFLDAHLMISEPSTYLDRFIDAGVNAITLHVETQTERLPELLQKIQDAGIRAGLSLNPKTPVERLRDFLPIVDLILVMSVEPGFGGQSFMEESLTKIETLARWREAQGLDYLISVDGGIDATTAPRVLDVGADILVSGSFLFGAEDRAAASNQLRQGASETAV